jgi:hypothetical protein
LSEADGLSKRAAIFAAGKALSPRWRKKQKNWEGQENEKGDFSGRTPFISGQGVLCGASGSKPVSNHTVGD